MSATIKFFDIGEQAAAAPVCRTGRPATGATGRGKAAVPQRAGTSWQRAPARGQPRAAKRTAVGARRCEDARRQAGRGVREVLTGGRTSAARAAGSATRRPWRTNMSVDTITEVSQYLTFKLDNEVFALDVATVREVLDFTTITRIPRTPGVHARRDQPAGQRGAGGGPAAGLRHVGDREDREHLHHRGGGGARRGDHGHRRPGGLGGGGDRSGAGPDPAARPASGPRSAPISSAAWASGRRASS